MNSPEDHSELINRILTGARWATFLKTLAQVLSWLSTIIVVRFISPQDYGLNSMLESPLVLMMLISTLGLETALVQSRTIKTNELQSIFGWLLTINGILFLTYFFGAGLLADYYNEPRLDNLAKALSIIFLLVPFRVIPNALLDRQLDFKLRGQLELFSSVASAIITLILAYSGAGIWALITGTITGKLLLSILLMAYKPWWITPKFNIFSTWRLMSMGGILTVASACALLSDQIPSIIGGPRLGPEILGIFALGAQFALLPVAKCMPIISQTMLPSFSNFRDRPDLASYYLNKTIGLISLILWPVMIGMICIADQFLPVVIGITWIESTQPLQIMSLGVIFRLNTMILRSVLIGLGQNNIALSSSFIQLVLLIPATLYAVNFGSIGLSTAWLITEIIVSLYITHKISIYLEVSIKRIFHCYLPATTCSAAMFICLMVIKYYMYNENNFYHILIIVSLGIAIYMSCVIIFFKSQFITAINTILGKR